jgi:hypothetical protein
MPGVTGHRVVVDRMGFEVETLADLLPAHPRAVCVGINPAPTSVAERLPPGTATDTDTTGEPGAPGTAPPTEAEDANLEGDPR